MATEPTLEELRPREWCVTWRAKRGPRIDDGWDNQERLWPAIDQALAHASALRDLGEVTGEVAHVGLSARIAALEAGDWEDITEW